LGLLNRGAGVINHQNIRHRVNGATGLVVELAVTRIGVLQQSNRGHLTSLLDRVGERGVPGGSAHAPMTSGETVPTQSAGCARRGAL
jgi:hypothetical protein